MKLYNTDSFEVLFDNIKGYLFLQCLDRLNSDDFRAGFLHALEFAEEHQVKHWLLDLREIGSLNDEEEAWLHKHLFPRIMVNLGTQNYVAMVLSEKCYQVLLTEAGKFGLQSYNSFIIMNNFSEIDDAINWLINKPLPQAS